MRVLSLFDGISCAREALTQAGVRVDAYYACEVDPNAIRIAMKNYPDTIQLGDVRELREPPNSIDLLIGGSPCQDLSIAKKNREGLKGNRSSLFWEYIRILRIVRPRWFILENVASMPKADRDIITQEMEVEPVMFNASLVSAQTRKRLFWTNIRFTLPPDQGILLKNILQPDAEVDESMTVNGKSFCLTASYHKVGETQAEHDHNQSKSQRTTVFHKTPQTGRNETKKLGYVGEHDHQGKRVYDDNGKLPALNAVCNSMVKVGYIGEGEQYGQGGQAHRVYSPEGKSATLSSAAPLIKLGYIGDKEHQANRVYSPEGKAPTQCKGPNGGATPTLVKLGHLGNSDSQANRIYSPEGKSVTLSANGGGLGAKTGLYETEHRIRKLTPIECERLQGLPDNYTEGIAKTNRYKCLGNGFCVPVITHILLAMKEFDRTTAEVLATLDDSSCACGGT